MQLCLPSSSTVRSYMGPLSHEFYGAGDKKMLATNADHIGDYVAKIVVDDRTLNQYVIIWEDEVTLAEAWEIAQKVSGEGDAMKAKTVHVRHEFNSCRSVLNHAIGRYLVRNLSSVLPLRKRNVSGRTHRKSMPRGRYRNIKLACNFSVRILWRTLRRWELWMSVSCIPN